MRGRFERTAVRADGHLGVQNVFTAKRGDWISYQNFGRSWTKEIDGDLEHEHAPEYCKEQTYHMAMKCERKVTAKCEMSMLKSEEMQTQSDRQLP